MATTLSVLNGAYKTRYGQLHRVIPEWAVLQGLIPFDSRKLLGKDFREQIWLTPSLGALFQSGTSLGTVGTYPNPISPHTEEAVIPPNELTMREQMAYGAIMAALNNGPAAMGNMLDEVILGMDKAHRFFVETAMIYGQTSLGTILGAPVSVSSTVYTVQLTQASWAVGLWSQFQGGALDVYASDGTTLINTNALVTMTGIADARARKLTLTGNSTDMSALADGQLLVFRGVAGAAPGAALQIMAGIDAIITNTGTLFGISAATYRLWRGNSITVPGGTGALTMSAIESAAAEVVGVGGYGDMTFLLSQYSWIDVMEDQAALRRYTESTKSGVENGTNKITFYGPNGGALTLVPHPMVKAGECFGLMTEDWKRIGVSDLTNRLPGHGEDDFFLQVPDKTACEIRNYSSQAIYTTKPARNIKITGIVPRTMPA